jgi:hypothetical protein
VRDHSLADGPLPCFHVTIPSAEQEAAFVWKLLTNITFYDRNHYALSMPHSDIVSILLEKVGKNGLSRKDMRFLQKDFQTTVYNKMDYQNGYRAVADVLPTADAKVAILQNYHDKDVLTNKFYK